jgi:hypothetical protein
MSVDWGLGLQQGNAGDAFSNAFQKGLQTNRENTARNAMATLVQNPNDPKALSELAKVDPQTAMEFRKQQIEQVKAQLGQHHDNIIQGAQILRQFNPKDQASYTAALQAAQAAGIDISQVPQQYNEQYVQGVIHIADALKPEAGAQDPGIIREFDIATQRHLVPEGTSFQQYAQMRNPGMTAPVTIPYGATVTAPGQAASGNVPQVHDQASYDAIPPGSQYMTPDGHMRVKGGSTAPAPSSGFPGPY